MKLSFNTKITCTGIGGKLRVIEYEQPHINFLVVLSKVIHTCYFDVLNIHTVHARSNVQNCEIIHVVMHSRHTLLQEYTIHVYIQSLLTTNFGKVCIYMKGVVVTIQSVKGSLRSGCFGLSSCIWGAFRSRLNYL